MEENFNMRKIHAGYVVEFRNGGARLGDALRQREHWR